MWVGVSFNRSKFCVSLTCRHVLGMAPLAPVAGRRAASLSLFLSLWPCPVPAAGKAVEITGGIISSHGPYAKAAEIKEPCRDVTLPCGRHPWAVTSSFPCHLPRRRRG